MKVVHVISGLDVGGAEMMLLKLLATLDRAVFEPEVISLRPGGQCRTLFEAQNIPVHSLSITKGVPSPASILALRRLGRDLDPDVVQGWMYHGNLAAVLLARFARGKPALYWNIRHSVADLGLEKPATRLAIRAGGLLSRKPQRIIFNSATSLGQHESLGYPRNKGLMIPNGFDLDRFRPSPSARTELRRELGLDPETALVGVAARRHPLKGHEDFLEAAARLTGAPRPVAFALAGQGVTFEDRPLMDLIKSLGLEGQVFLLGPRQDMPAFMAGLDLLCVPSLGEAFPNVLGEAMACEVPCVATDVGDSRHIIADTGRAVPPGLPDALAAAMGELLDLDSAARTELGGRCRSRIRENYSLENIAGHYASLYRSGGEA